MRVTNEGPYGARFARKGSSPNKSQREKHRGAGGNLDENLGAISGLTFQRVYEGCRAVLVDSIGGGTRIEQYLDTGEK